MKKTIKQVNLLLTSVAVKVYNPDGHDRLYRELEARHNELETRYQRIIEQIDVLSHRRIKTLEISGYLATRQPLAFRD
ncbi:hypothetical protein [Rothia nasimurium]|uniref:hypothetical protein n=1 Tax=Rothia nasimurium TaxID=85336 RepID=UPI003BA202A4